MRSREIVTGRTILVVFDHGEDFYHSPTACAAPKASVRATSLPSSPVSPPQTSSAPASASTTRTLLIWSKVHLTNIEALGVGTSAAYTDGSGTLAARSRES